MIILGCLVIVATLAIAYDLHAIHRERERAAEVWAKIQDDTWERWVADVESRGGEEL